MSGAALAVVAVVGFLAFANGANDVSKGVAPLVGSGVADYRRAITWGTAWTVMGALLGAPFAGAMLATFGKGLLAPDASPAFASAAAALAGAAGWVVLATRTGLPVSTTHALVGSVVGAAVSVHGPGAVQWGALGGKVFLPLVASPIAAFLLTGLGLRALRARTPSAAPAPDCLCADLEPTVLAGWGPASTALARGARLRLTVGTTPACAEGRAGTVPLTLGHMQWLFSAATSLARGMNDAPKIVALGLAASMLGAERGPSQAALFLAAAAGMAAGGLAAGRRVTHVLAEKVTEMDVPGSLAASAVTAVLVTAGAMHGLSMSTTHVALGGIAAAGAHRGALNGRTLPRLALAWVVTFPASAALGAAGYAPARALGL